MTTTHRITTAIVAALALATSAAPASAGQFDLNAHGSYVPAGSASMQAHSPATPSPPTSPLAIVRVTPRDNGFDWGDAGIGAVGGFAVSMIGLGGVLAVSTRGTRRTRHATALTS